MDPIEIVISNFKNSGSSLRSYSKLLEISPSTLSKILSGKRGIPKSQAKRFAQKLVADTSLHEEFIEAVLEHKTLTHINKNLNDLILDQNDSVDMFNILAEWEYFAILNVIKIKIFDHTPTFLARSLNISLKRVHHCLHILNKNNFISLDNGEIKRLARNIDTTNDVLSRALKLAHLEELELAKNRINVDVERKYYQSMTFTMAQKDMTKLKRYIDKMISDAEKLTDNSEPEEVYLLSTQLFPITLSKPIRKTPKKKGLKIHEH